MNPWDAYLFFLQRPNPGEVHRFVLAETGTDLDLGKGFDLTNKAKAINKGQAGYDLTVDILKEYNLL